MKKLIVLLDGGLGNKLNGLFQGIHISQKTQRDIVITNIKNNFGNFSFTSLFDFNYDYVDVSSFGEFDKTCDSSIPIYIHKNYYTFNRPSFHFQSIHTSPHDNIIMLTDRMNLEDFQLIEYLNDFTVKKHIIDVVRSFIQKNDINNNCIGIHIRGTDFSSRDDNISNAHEIINKHQNEKIFLCTDEKEIQESFVKYPNVIYFDKTHFVEKLDVNLNWTGTIQDVDKRKWNYNVNRLEESVIESFIDMLLLSTTNMHGNKSSTFYKWANIIKTTKFLEKSLNT